MTLKLKPIDKQVVVISGATSGIGLVTARLAAKRGAKVVLIARNVVALHKLNDELRATGAQSKCFALDVAEESLLRAAASDAERSFGQIDTWINNAGVSIYGKLEDIPTSDSRRLFDTNFWGVVNGSLLAVKHLREKGGALINIGSTLGDRAIPIQGMYSASKHAVKGFTDALRMEIEADGLPISTTLIKPAAIDTPYKEHARNYLGVKPENPPPVYAPDAVAEAILHCAENPVRDVFVGGGAKAMSVLGHYAPRITDRFMENLMIDAQKTNESPEYEQEGLFRSSDNALNERGDYTGHVAETSFYTKASLRPVKSGTILAVGAGLAFLLGRSILASRASIDADPLGEPPHRRRNRPAISGRAII